MKQVQDVIERLWDFIDKLDINTFGKLLTGGHLRMCEKVPKVDICVFGIFYCVVTIRAVSSLNLIVLSLSLTLPVCFAVSTIREVPG